jgi:uncharacterized membrane protein (GlpM family)
MKERGGWENITKTIIGCLTDTMSLRGVQSYGYYLAGLIPLAQKAALFLRTISSTITSDRYMIANGTLGVALGLEISVACIPPLAGHDRDLI